MSNLPYILRIDFEDNKWMKDLIKVNQLLTKLHLRNKIADIQIILEVLEKHMEDLQLKTLNNL